MMPPLAITFDWYGTLASHRAGLGRGANFADYLKSQGLKSDPWDRRVLYEVFEFYADAYRPESPASQKRSFWIEFTNLLFEKCNVHGVSRSETHSDAIESIFGSNCLALFDEVKPVLLDLKRQGMRLGVVSNWHRGLNHFCDELGVGSCFDVIVASEDIGVEKPDPRIFREALRRLAVSSERAVHVGDLIDADYEGATASGMGALLIDRAGTHSRIAKNRIQNLYELKQWLDRD